MKKLSVSSEVKKLYQLSETFVIATIHFQINYLPYLNCEEKLSFFSYFKDALH